MANAKRTPKQAAADKIAQLCHESSMYLELSGETRGVIRRATSAKELDRILGTVDAGFKTAQARQSLAEYEASLAVKDAPQDAPVVDVLADFRAGDDGNGESESVSQEVRPE